MSGRSPSAARFDPPVRKWEGRAPATLQPNGLAAWIREEAALDELAWAAVRSHQGLWVDRHRWEGGPVEAGARVVVYAFTQPPEPVALQAADVLLDLGDVVAVAKPAWLPVQGSRATAKLSLEVQARALLGCPALRVVHRLDRETSGVLLLARTGAAAGALHAEFRAGRVEKRYLAVVRPPIERATTVRGDLRRVEHARHSRFALGPDGSGQASETTVRPVATEGIDGLVEARPVTGRTHQIRVHLAHLGSPIAGDALYGGPWREGEPERCQLHAAGLAVWIAGRLVDVSAPPPHDGHPLFTMVAR